MPSYQASQLEYMRVRACDTCNQYIGTVDMTKDDRAAPEVDKLATLPLNLWAEEKGYIKIQSNVLGM